MPVRSHFKQRQKHRYKDELFFLLGIFPSAESDTNVTLLHNIMQHTWSVYFLCPIIPIQLCYFPLWQQLPDWSSAAPPWRFVWLVISFPTHEIPMLCCTTEPGWCGVGGLRLTRTANQTSQCNNKHWVLIETFHISLYWPRNLHSVTNLGNNTSLSTCR